MSVLDKLRDCDVEWRPLSSICDLVTTGKLNANAMEDDGKYPFFTCNEHPYKINTYAFDLEAILISGNGSQEVKKSRGVTGVPPFNTPVKGVGSH